ncbi:cell wall-binding repeat-containing protein [Haloimpatiens sp. FM7330]|uniref:cell wall-binding repeat-containing protein n=1 Tax=Haloimpatiens sp. FM7330 TaxID=3298610 RepID=UPI003639E99D
MNKAKIIAAFCGMCCFFTCAGTNAYASDQNQSAKFKRIFGQTRYETSTKISSQGWQESKYVIIANGIKFPDALCAGPLGQKLNAPIILCDGNKLNKEAIDEIKRLKAENAFVIGGEGAVSNNVISELNALNIKSKRLAGQTRYETSLEIAKEVGLDNGAVFASGLNFPDALSIAPIASSKQMPILLSQKDKLPDKVEEFISNKELAQSYIVGGTGVVSDKVKANISNCKRVGGKNRYDTNVAILNEFGSDVSFNKVYLTLGENFPDALCGSVIASKTKSPVVLVSVYDAYETKDFVKNKGIKDENIVLLGGEKIMPNTILEKKKRPPKKVPPKVVPPKKNNNTNKNQNANVDKLVKPSIVYATVTANVSGYKRGQKVQIIKDISNGVSYRVYANGRYATISRRYLSIPSDPATNRSRMTTQQLEAYINKKGFSSRTKYFIWVDLNRQIINVFTGSKAHWKYKVSFSCATGKNVTPTVRGNFAIGDRGGSFYSKYGVGAKYWIRFYGNYLFHSILVNTKGTVVDSTLGKRASHGCIRVGMNNIKWMYYNVPINTGVWVN